MKRHAILFLPLFCITALPASAAEMTLRSKVDTVTVFPDGAEVSRTFDASMDAGAHVLILADLPATLEEDSIRVEGEGTSTVEIGSVDARRIVVKKPGAGAGLDDTERKRIEDEIKRLDDERVTLNGLILAANTQKELAENLSRLPTAPASRKDADSNGGKAMDWNALFDIIGTHMQDSAKAVQAAQIKQRDLDERIKVLQERLNLQPKEEWERTEIRINVEARGASKGTFTVRYQVESANWQPVYDARLATGGKGKEATLTIARRASISQESGEDWDDAALTLSTTRPGGDTAAPELNTVKVNFKPEVLPASQEKMMMRSRGAGAEPPMAMAPAPIMAEKQHMDRLGAQERQAEVETTTYQAAFKLPQRVSVKSGVGEKKVFIASETPKPALMVKTTPRKDATAFLHAKFTYDGAAPILPGEVSLFRDGVFTGHGQFPLIVKGEEKELGFGRDDGVKVTRVELKRAKGETGIISASSTDEQQFKMTVKNLHDWQVPVTLTDQIPVSEDEKITVELLSTTTEPTTRNPKDKQGLLVWNFDLKPQAEKEITLGYAIKWPVKREIVIEGE